jgi:nicotinate-nucleotide adenylyltransferase
VDALLGGSYDPVHLGHLIVAETAADALGGRVRLMPAREQPFKRTAHQASPEHRLAMLELAAAGNARLLVEPIELSLPAPSYTVETLRVLAEREPGNRFVLLLGADAAQDLGAWHEVGTLPQLAEVVAFARPGWRVPAHPFIRRVIEVPAVDISATLIRQRVSAGQSIRYLVPDSVREYIAARGLYR